MSERPQVMGNAPHPMIETAPEYTREEMRQACQNNYNAALEAACGALSAVAIEANRPECCDSAAYDRGECCGNPNLLVTAVDVARAIRALKERADD